LLRDVLSDRACLAMGVRARNGDGVHDITQTAEQWLAAYPVNLNPKT
jgi:hypothetical protein